MKRTIFQSPTLNVELARFSAGAGQSRHTDRCSRITLTLWGGFREEAANGAARIGPGDILFKSRVAAHEDCFGPNGARVASIVFHGDDEFDAAGGAPWRVRRDGAALRHALAALEAALVNDDGGVSTATADLLGACADPPPERTPPPWLRRLKEALDAHGLAYVNVAGEARAAGVHPAHASRLFRRCYGRSVTDYAQTQSVRRAFGPLAGKAPLPQVALAAGFYDQSHMTRVFRRVLGRTPGAQRALLAAAG